MFLQASVILLTGGEYLTRYPPWDQVHPPGPGTPWDQVHPPGPGTPPQTRYNPPGPGTPLQTRYTPRDQVHPQDQVTPLGPGTPPWDQVHTPGTRYTPWDQVHHPWTRYTPLGPGTPWDQVHPPGPGTSQGFCPWGLCEGHPPKGICDQRQRPPLVGTWDQAGSDIIQRHPPSMDRMIDTSKNITSRMRTTCFSDSGGGDLRGQRHPLCEQNDRHE